MDRRRFIMTLSVLPIAGLGTTVVSTKSLLANNDETFLATGYKSFAYYQGLGAAERRNPSRTDGTYSSMPCIPWEDVTAGIEKTYNFWHGHGSQHTFTITAEMFVILSEGNPVELYTSVVDDHRHALRVSPAEECPS